MRKVIVLLMLCSICLAFTGCKKSEPEKAGMPDMDAAAAKMTDAVTQTVEQTMCPVMGGEINKDIFVEYKGQKVYFCCKACVAKFEANPEKYVSNLPQFKK